MNLVENPRLEVVFVLDHDVLVESSRLHENEQEEEKGEREGQIDEVFEHVVVVEILTRVLDELGLFARAYKLDLNEVVREHDLYGGEREREHA